MKLESVNQLRLHSLSDSFGSEDRTRAFVPLFVSSWDQKKKKTQPRLSCRSYFSPAFILLHHIADRKLGYSPPPLATEPLHGRNFIYNKGVIYEIVKALTSG